MLFLQRCFPVTSDFIVKPFSVSRYSSDRKRITFGAECDEFNVFLLFQCSDIIHHMTSVPVQSVACFKNSFLKRPVNVLSGMLNCAHSLSNV